MSTIPHIMLQASGGGGGFMSLQMIILLAMFAVVYLFMIRPQQRKAKEQDNFLSELKRGQTVVTTGGIIGKISKIEGNVVTLALDSKSTARFTKGAISKEMSDALEAATSSGSDD